MEIEIREYIRDPFGNPMGLMLATINEDYPMFVNIGVSMCHKNDKFDKKIAYDIANKRAKNPNVKYKIKLYTYKHMTRNRPYMRNTDDCIEEFIGRCSRYFKNKMIILPKIEFI